MRDLPFPHSPELLAAFRAAPDDDAPLLVLADWLQERGQAWGELIAVQLALGQTTEPSPERARLLRREHELVSTRETWWPYDGVGFRVESFVRGFPSRIRAENVAGLRTLVSRMPWLAADDIEVVLDESSMLGLVGLPRLPTHGFTFTSGFNYYFDLLDAKMLVQWLERHTIALRRFGMHGMASTQALERVFSSPVATRKLEAASFANIARTSWQNAAFDAPWVKRLSITGDSVVPPWGAVTRYEELELSQRMCPAPAFIARLERATRLALVAMGVDDVAGVATLDAAPPNITSIALAQNPIGLPTVERLVARPTLRAAELWSTKIGDEGVEMLSQTGCEVLELANVGMTERGAEFLLNSSTLPPTLRLTLSTGEVGSVLPALRERFAVVIAR